MKDGYKVALIFIACGIMMAISLGPLPSNPDKTETISECISAVETESAPPPEEPAPESLPELPEPACRVETMRIYHYCACTYCTPGTGITASGKQVEVGMVAMYGVPFGTVVEIRGERYAVEDRGVGPGKIDVFVESHEEALQLGTYVTEVKIYEEGLG